MIDYQNHLADAGWPGAGGACGAVGAIMACGWWAGPAGALTPATLTSPELESRDIVLNSVIDGQLSYFDQDRRLVQRSAGDFVELTFASPPRDMAAVREAREAASAGDRNFFEHIWIELTDGQRFWGTWSGASADGETLQIQHEQLGMLAVHLDDVRMLTRWAPGVGVLGRSQEASGGVDKLVTGNGDLIQGFLLRAGPEQIEFLADGSSRELRLPLADVSGLMLSNPRTAETPEAGVDLVKLDDGSQVRVTGLAIRGERAAMTPVLSSSEGSVDLPLSRMRRVQFGASDRRLVALEDLEWTVTAGGSVFGLSVPPRVEREGGRYGHDRVGWRLHAPVTLEFELPAGAVRFVAAASLDLPSDLEAGAGQWADVVLWIDEDTPNQEVRGGAGSTDDPRRARLLVSQPTAALNVPLKPGQASLTLRLDPATNGPILDRVALREAWVLVRDGE